MGQHMGLRPWTAELWIPDGPLLARLFPDAWPQGPAGMSSRWMRTHH